jgi:restriction endonuclease
VVINHTDQLFSVNASDRIAQLIVKKIAFPTPVKTFDLDKTARETSGFGSTGITNIDFGLHNTISRHMSEDTFRKSIRNALENNSTSFPERMSSKD